MMKVGGTLFASPTHDNSCVGELVDVVKVLVIVVEVVVLVKNGAWVSGGCENHQPTHYSS